MLCITVLGAKAETLSNQTNLVCGRSKEGCLMGRGRMDSISLCNAQRPRSELTTCFGVGKGGNNA